MLNTSSSQKEFVSIVHQYIVPPEEQLKDIHIYQTASALSEDTLEEG